MMVDLHAAVRRLPTGDALLKIALDTAARDDVPVFPIWVYVDYDPKKRRDKLEKTTMWRSNGHLDATRDPAAIRSAFTGKRANLFGVPTGPASGFFALDIDPRDGGDVWEAANRDIITPTRTHATMSGGRHYLYPHVPGLRCSNGANGGIAPGVDIKADGGWVVWWPAAGLGVS